MDIQEQIEEWRPIKGYEHYEVSNFGRVRKISYLRNWTCTKVGYPQIQIFETDGCGKKRIGSGDKGKVKKFFIHRLVAQAFIDNPENKPVVNHKDGNKQNFHMGNLEWLTYSENLKHAYKKGLKKPNKGKRLKKAA